MPAAEKRPAHAMEDALPNGPRYGSGDLLRRVQTCTPILSSQTIEDSVHRPSGRGGRLAAGMRRGRERDSDIEGAPTRSQGARVSSTGVLIGHYERDGEVKIRDGALDSPSKREIARQERMKREG